jgi:hypothetical protein
MIDSLDREASMHGVTRQSVIKVWLAERLKASKSNLPVQRTRSGDTHRWTSRKASPKASPNALFAVHALRPAVFARLAQPLNLY